MLARKHKVSSRVICTSSFWVSYDYRFFKQIVSAGAWCLTQKNIHIQSLDIKATCPTSWKLNVGEAFLSGHCEWQRLSWNRQKYIWRAPLIHSSFLENAWTCWLDLTCLPLSMLILFHTHPFSHFWQCQRSWCASSKYPTLHHSLHLFDAVHQRRCRTNCALRDDENTLQVQNTSKVKWNKPCSLSHILTPWSCTPLSHKQLLGHLYQSSGRKYIQLVDLWQLHHPFGCYSWIS